MNRKVMSAEAESKTPALILVNPQLGENIGAAARIAANFGFSDLRIVNPRDGWPNPAAEAMAAGALEVITPQVYARLEDALKDIHTVYATTARPRDMEKIVYGADEAIALAKAKQSQGQTIGILFGAEKAGLHNDVIAGADAIITLPISPKFSSLNLAQAVAVIAYEWVRGEAQNQKEAQKPFEEARELPATKQDFEGMMGHLQAELEEAGYFYPPEKTDLMMRNLKAAFARGEWTTQEVQTFRGVIKALAKGRGEKWRAGRLLADRNQE